jgi:dihydroorotate dehydrogenase electron transfer subunit
MDYTVLRNNMLTPNIFELILHAPGQEPPQPGQFVNVQIDGQYLRRPISVCDWTHDTLTLIYKVVGEGTAKLAKLRQGTTLNLLANLGNGFTVQKHRGYALVVGGGVGCPPLFGLIKTLRAQGRRVVAIFGFNTAADIFYLDRFCTLCQDVHITTVDGSTGTRGFVTDALPLLPRRPAALYACGPMPMLRALYDAAPALPPGFAQFSFEERMACGFGACMGCSCQTKEGSKRICKDGPVLLKEEIVW